jgi:pSer/pThr/pTyr-binding forkhead associated (FHA) protein
MANLTYQRSDGTAVKLELSNKPLTFGSSQEADVRIVGTDVSPLHCAIRLYRGKCLIKDLDSQSGTFVNGKRVELVKLRAGDQIRVGKTVFEVDVPRKGVSTLMNEANAEMKRGKGLKTVLREIIAEDARDPHSWGPS